MKSESPENVPFNTFVIKTVSRCNLNCSYCYMYNLADRTYRDQPGVMSELVTERLASRIATHAKAHGLANVHIVMHGGEPLLMGIPRFTTWVETMRKILSTETNPFFSMQSNGVLISNDWIDALIESGVGIGVSVDGPKKYHDAFRVDHKGNGSFNAVVQGIRTLQAHPRGCEIFSTVMGVVNPSITPKELFRFWQFLDVPGFDLSLPHANHLHRPPKGSISYGKWLIDFFDLWFDQNRSDRHIRYFENILRMIFGYQISTDNIGGKPVGVVVVETNGGIEPTDAFKCCEEGITKIGMNVVDNDFDDLYKIDMVQDLQHGASRLCSTCQGCDLRNVCGGGYMPHRYSREKKFDNPSIYCRDLESLIRHIRRRVDSAIPDELQQKLMRTKRAGKYAGN